MNYNQWIALDDDERRKLVSRLRLSTDIWEDEHLTDVRRCFGEQLNESLGKVPGILLVDIGRIPDDYQACVGVIYDGDVIPNPQAEIGNEYHGFPVVYSELGADRRRYRDLWLQVLRDVFGWSDQDIDARLWSKAERIARNPIFFYNGPMYYVALAVQREYLPDLDGDGWYKFLKSIERLLASEYRVGLSNEELRIIRAKVDHVLNAYRVPG